MIKKRMTEFMYDKETKKHFAKLWKEIDFKKANIVKQEYEKKVRDLAKVVKIEFYPSLKIKNRGTKIFKSMCTNKDAQDLNLNLERVKMPSGGSTSFEMGDPEHPDTVKELNCVIIYNKPQYSYYAQAYDGSNKMPDCFSNDGITGCGNPGGNCKSCPMNKFQSAGNGISKACKNKRQLFLVLENMVFPIELLLPTGSLQAFTKYVQFNLYRQRKLSNIVTKITLKKTTNKTGIAFSQAVFTYVRDLTEKEIESLKGVADFVKTYASNSIPAFEPADDKLPFADETTGEKVEPLVKG